MVMVEETHKPRGKILQPEETTLPWVHCVDGSEQVSHERTLRQIASLKRFNLASEWYSADFAGDRKVE